jgi:hypothetical protein
MKLSQWLLAKIAAAAVAADVAGNQAIVLGHFCNLGGDPGQIRVLRIS